MDKPLISVITPVYAVEPYIHDYLDSILAQTYTNLQIICVNDGSPDNCGSILDAYAAKDPRISVIHQHNAGYPSALNRGLESALGAYIGFVDPDDYLESNFYEELLSLSQKTSADISVSSFCRDKEDHTEKMKNLRPIPQVFSDKNAAFRYGFESDIYRGFKMFLWNKLFRAKFFSLKSSGGLNLRMDQSLSTGGDVLLTSKCILAADKIACTPDALYHYRIRQSSLIRNNDFHRRLGLNDAFDQVINLLERASLHESTINLVKRFHTYYASQLAEYAVSINDKPNLQLSKALISKYLDTYLSENKNFPDRIERINKILEIGLE